MKNFKVIIVDPVHPSLIINLKKKKLFVKYAPGINYDKLSKIIKNFHVIIVRSGITLDKKLIQKAKSLNVIARAGVGMDNIDLQEAKKNKIKCFNVPSQSNLSVAEHAFGLIFSAARKINFCDRLLRKNIWKKKEMYGFELSNKKLGIIGLGNIGKKIADIGKKFNMKILASVNNFNIERKKKFKKKNIILTSLNNLLSNSDFITICVPLNEKTKNLINTKNLKLLKKDSIIVNISRGGVVNEDSLYNALIKKSFFAAATDVFKEERKNNKLFKLNNIVVTSHIGAMTYEAQKRIAIMLEKKLLMLLKKY